jgi:hypothetical protein
MNANQIRHLLSAHEGANLLDAKVREVGPDGGNYVEVAERTPMPMVDAKAREVGPDGGNYYYSSFTTRTVYLNETCHVRREGIKAAYDYQTHTIYFRRVG